MKFEINGIMQFDTKWTQLMNLSAISLWWCLCLGVARSRRRGRKKKVVGNWKCHFLSMTDSYCALTVKTYFSHSYSCMSMTSFPSSGRILSHVWFMIIYAPPKECSSSKAKKKTTIIQTIFVCLFFLARFSSLFLPLRPDVFLTRISANPGSFQNRQKN